MSVRGACQRVGVLARHEHQGGLVAFLESEPLSIRAVAQDRRILSAGVAAVFIWPKDVGAQHQSVVHAHGHVPVDLHALNLGGGVKGGVTEAICFASWNSAGSLQRFPTICSPIGRPTCEWV